MDPEKGTGVHRKGNWGSKYSRPWGQWGRMQGGAWMRMKLTILVFQAQKQQDEVQDGVAGEVL